jgi:hypothetical protein
VARVSAGPVRVRVAVAAAAAVVVVVVVGLELELELGRAWGLGQAAGGPEFPVPVWVPVPGSGVVLGREWWWDPPRCSTKGP